MSSRLISAFFVLLGFTALVSACQPDPIDIDLPQQPSKLVVASLLSTIRDTTLGVTDSVLAVAITRSTSALSGASEGVTDSAMLFQQLVPHARVVLVGHGRSDTLQNVGYGAYLLPSPQLVPGTPYTLVVFDSTTLLSCTAITTYLPQMRFDYVKPTVQRTPTDTTVTLEYQLTDKPGASFYLVQMVPLTSDSFGGSVGSITGAGDVSNALNQVQNQQNLRLLTDQDFVDGRYKISEKLRVRGSDTVMLGVAQISEDYFRFLEAYRRSGKLFNQITGEPINYPTNVENGYGFFGLHSLGVRLIDLNQY